MGDSQIVIDAKIVTAASNFSVARPCLLKESTKQLAGGVAKSFSVTTLSDRQRQSSQDDDGMDGGDARRSHAPFKACGGATATQHHGGLVRGRAAAGSGVRRPATSAGGGADAHRGNGDAGVRGTRTSRIYSSPLFLHTAVFPPKGLSMCTVQKAKALAAVQGSERTRLGIDRILDLGREDEWKAGAFQTATTAANGGAPGRHRQRGYLHRYMGFERERVSSPAVKSFRTSGGLGGSSRRSIDLSGGSNYSNGHQVKAARTEMGKRLPGTYRASERCADDLSPNIDRAPRTRGKRRNQVVPINDDGCVVGLFAKGSALAPTSPPNAERRGPPVWYSGSKKRPHGAKLQKAWEVDAPGRLASRETRTEDAIYHRRHTLESSGIKCIRLRRARGCKISSEPDAIAFLPYSLARPVSPVKTQAFLYTCN